MMTIIMMMTLILSIAVIFYLHGESDLVATNQDKEGSMKKLVTTIVSQPR